MIVHCISVIAQGRVLSCNADPSGGTEKLQTSLLYVTGHSTYPWLIHNLLQIACLNPLMSDLPSSKDYASLHTVSACERHFWQASSHHAVIDSDQV